MVLIVLFPYQQTKKRFFH